jgi:hypothetical protein
MDTPCSRRKEIGPRRDAASKRKLRKSRLSFDLRLDIGVGRRLFKIMVEHLILHAATPATSGYYGDIHREKRMPKTSPNPNMAIFCRLSRN